jgi:hypothetical protein
MSLSHESQLKRLATYEARRPMRFWAKVDKRGDNECWLWLGGKNRYGKFSDGQNSIGAHCYSWKLHRGAIPDGKCVLHDCPGGDNPLCVNPNHLKLGTQAENQWDKVAKGRQAKGSQQGHSRLTESEVLAIKSAFVAGERRVLIAQRHGIPLSYVYALGKGQAWRHV